MYRKVRPRLGELESEWCGVTCDKSQLAMGIVGHFSIGRYHLSRTCLTNPELLSHNLWIEVFILTVAISWGKNWDQVHMVSTVRLCTRCLMRSAFHYLGRVYQAREIGGQTVVVVKIAHSGIEANALKHEYHILGQLSSYAGVPKALWLGREEELHVMVLESLGPSLEEHFNACGHKFSLITVALIAGQLVRYRAYDHVSGLTIFQLSHLQNIHSRHYIHRDIKPANILTGLGDSAHIVYLADFGIAKRFRNPKTHAHVPLSNGHHLTGSPAFTSINSHLGIELSRRDDLESLAYVLIYLLRGSLPWINMGGMDIVLHLKQQTTPDELCSGLPTCFKSILEYSRTLPFTTKPDYALLHSYIKDMHAALPDVHEICDWQRPASACLFKVKTKSTTPKLKTRRRKSTKVGASGEAMPQRV
jgi:serine/threonine protein kinase